MNLLLLLGIGLLLLLMGILLGRFYTPDRRPLERAAEEGISYARGLVEVLDGDSDAAILEIARTLKKNVKTIEPYFALGTLFRQKGEYERAVRVHQTILMRRDLTKELRLRVHHQLALDFKAAGFPRRAIKALEWILTKDKKRLSALKELADLYEDTQQWEKAAIAYRKVAKLGGEDTSTMQAHMLVEVAHQYLTEGDKSSAQKYLKRAFAACSQSIHALFVLGVYHEQYQNFSAAAKVWQKALKNIPDLAAFFAPRLERACYEIGKAARYQTSLNELLQENPGNLHLRLALARFEARTNPREALTELSQILEEAPNLIPARREAARLVLEAGDATQIKSAFNEILELLARADRGYRCHICGHTQEDLFWRCPSCYTWDSVRVAWGRRKGEEP